MATGSIADITSRLQRWLPARWFPTQAVNSDGTVPRVYAQLVSWATGLQAIWTQIQYTIAQTRLGTSTDGWLDLLSQDYFGGDLPRLSGETDAAFQARIAANLFLPANTPAAIQSAVESVTGYPARLIEPWQPAQTFVWGRSFWGVNTAANPGQWANGNQRYQGLIQCALPAATGSGGNPRFGWGNFFWGSGLANAVALGAWWTSFSGENGANLVYAIVNRLKMVGTTIYVQFVPPSQLLPPSQTLINDEGWVLLSNAGAYPTSPTGLAAGALWSNGLVVSIVPGATPNPAAPAVFFVNMMPASLLALGGGNLPLSQPTPGSGQLWNDGGIVAVA
jgi:hypothetical protein